MNKFWYIDGKPHRVDGPAAEFDNGDNFWYLNGGLHRIDGPAVDYVDGIKEYYLNGQKYSFEEWNILRKLPWLI